MKKWIYFIVLSCLCCACHHRESIYHQYRHLPQQTWHRQDSLSFDIRIEPHLAAKHQHQAVYYRWQMEEDGWRHYPYQNLMVAVESHCDSVIYRDTIDLMQKENLPAPCPFRLSADKFPYKVVVYHLMQDESLINLHRLGLEITIQ